MSRGVPLLPLAALGVTAWAALWSLIALSNPELPAVSERMTVDQPIRLVRSEADMDVARDRLEVAFADKAAAALRERLGFGYRFEMTRLESLTLRDDRADARLWGLLIAANQAPAMLRVDLRLDRRTQQVERLYAQAYGEREDDPFITAWIANDPGTLQAAR
ncbi:hypothetical protein [Pseudomarimonas salicorniae]|uniref:DUF3016 domain-containing protein n=1 Tax=Pseudomarimonas salicorniae TaxID=2933270 RepID=A0ABT0GFX6_9GAMM|nr:hypothetical protein [Lysobacter sp. CAU 1642]MCK7593252.1 hypothetical protein [Lysobacter sp. CAU 1642]